MKIDILTLFPQAFDSFLSHSIVKRAIEAKKVTITPIDLRAYTHDRHKTADDRPFGGGPGMLMKPEPIFEAMDALTGGKKLGKTERFIVMSPRGVKFTQKVAQEFSKLSHIIVLCGHYEGVDERVLEHYGAQEVSIGDFVLTGGEVPAMAVIDAAVRLVPGVLGSADSGTFESFNSDLLEYPQYTRPAEYRGRKVPEVLLSGNHARIEEWRMKQAKELTRKRRPDLLKARKKSKK